MVLSDVQQTLFYPLLGRAGASRSFPDLFPGPWAHRVEDIVRAEGATLSRQGDFANSVYGLGHLIIVREIRDYLTEHPGAAVVNIGCGLDCLDNDLEDFDCTLYNLDFPEIIEMRSRWITTSDSVDLPFSVLDPSVDGTG